MEFLVKPAIKSCNGLGAFFAAWNIGKEDLLVTNEFVMGPVLQGAPYPCDVLFQEQYGQGEPNDEMIDAMLRAIEGKSYKRIVAIGGGSVIDIAKLFVFGGGLTCEEIFAQGAALPRTRSLVIVPTTCGTGSEVTGISIVGFVKKGTKIGLALPALYADEAVLIAELLATLPYEVFATSSIDALIHAMESYVSPKANSFTQAMGARAIHQILQGYKAIAASGSQAVPGPQQMHSFLTASTMAGIAFGNAGCGAVHALSYPIGGLYHVPHGKANYMVFQEVFATYRALGANLVLLEEVLEASLGCPRQEVWQALFALLASVYANQTLGALGVTQTVCAQMAQGVVQNQQRLLANNPIPLTQQDILGIYNHCL